MSSAPSIGEVPDAADKRGQLTVNGLSKSYGRSDPCLADISLEIDESTFVSILGPSGCGKSTLLRIVAGLLSPSTGIVTFDGDRIAEPHPQMVYVFQQYTKSVLPWQSVLQNATFGLRHRTKLSKSDQSQVAMHMLERVGLSAVKDKYPYELSGGMQQRLALARALACKPRVLLMDEPCSNVDAITKAGLQDLILDVWTDFRPTVLFVTHDVDEAAYLSQRILVMSAPQGRVVADMDVGLPYPRTQLETRKDPRYIEVRDSAYHLPARQDHR